MAGGGGSDGDPEFQVAPMVDVLLTILIFFMMITSAQVLKVDKSITLPVAPDARKKESKAGEIVVNVRWHPIPRSAEFVVDEKIYRTAGEISGPLREAKAADEKKGPRGKEPFRAVIRGDRDVPALFVSQAMNVCAEAGISDISFSTLNKAR